MTHRPDINPVQTPDHAGSFYDDLSRTFDFDAMTDPTHYSDVPDNWLVGVADVVDSTAEIAAGRYKVVNMVGAAVISAMINALKPRNFPFVFGGDGAEFAIWPEAAGDAERALAAVQTWAAREFDITLRVALVAVRDIKSAGKDLRVARYRPAPGVDYAMFTGGGLTWAEAQMKAGAYAVPPGPTDAVPDLTGLSCRWSNLTARHSAILSIVILPGSSGTDRDFGDVTREILRLADGLDRNGHPMPQQGPGVQYPPPGLTIEARASRGTRSYARRWFELMAENLFAWAVLRSGLQLGRFDPARYRTEVATNADFRKFDDGLKMTLDCDAETRDQIRALLTAAQSRGVVKFGLYEQDEALVTCFVPSAVENDHIHFVDGAGGGYTRAAAQIKMGGT